MQETAKIGLLVDMRLHDWSYKKTALWLFRWLSVGITANNNKFMLLEILSLIPELLKLSFIENYWILLIHS
ncbi:hypothetical protein RhiirA5_364873 [Rhizophagus irregularis]|uniref:Uncharacterized protein n=2 Tax=Rhizophagus irregularis TaxID=588596 RepID=A0A2I1ENM1_9GLOM|nr:hypothetical protein RhiirA5_364873 [Rhizophagus irregularis]PKC66110.1 hypothetical protein RhiirA1_419741 [Rhizophagus irregularis]PKY23702.1 hypothetical protein RhiirB3_412146 [Rhizophagus irregularis]GBC19495.1 hypothetical protein RIR_jg41759.t1 [Rhizophagus irregularis DAOM 181602=DAOM 197198]